MGQGLWVVQGDSPTSISGSWQGRRWCAIVPPLIRGTALGSSPSSYLGANTLSAPLLTVGQEVRPKPRASALSWLPSHLLGSQSVLCPCGPLQSRARARPCSQPSPSLAQVWLKEPQHVSSILTPSSTSLSRPECAEAKLELSSHSPSNSHPRHKRIFSGGSFRREPGDGRINRKRLQSTGEGGGSRNFLASHREAPRWHLGCAHQLPPTQRSQDGSCAASTAPADWHAGSREGQAELV